MSDAQLNAVIDALAQLLPQANRQTLSLAAEMLLRGQQPTVGASTASITFGEHNSFQDASISIGSIAGGDILNIAVHLPEPLDPLPAARILFASMPRDYVPEPALDLPASSRIPLSRNPRFVGRAEDLMSLARAIAAPSADELGMAVVAGIGGIGKTSLAVEFAYRYGRYFPGGVFWLNCADPAAVGAEVAACASHLGLPTSGVPYDEQTAAVRRLWQDPMPRLLIFDNCEDPKLLDEWAPTIGGCRMLLTSRRGDWPHIPVVYVGALPRPASVNLLQKLAPALPDDDAGRVAEMLGDLPLALHLAGRYLERMHGVETPAHYLERLVAVNPLNHPAFKGRALSSGEVLPTRHEQDIARTFAISFEQLALSEHIDRLALHLLACLSRLAPGNVVPEELLRRLLPAGTEPLEWIEVRDRLVALGLSEVQAGGGMRTHSLIHSFLRMLADIPQNEAYVAQVLCGYAKQLNDHWHPASLAPLLPHLRWMVNQCAEIHRIGLLHQLSDHLIAAGDYLSAHPLCLRSLRLSVHIHGGEDLLTATSLNHLATFHYRCGAYIKARLCYERALVIRSKLLGPTNVDTADCLHNLAEVCHTLGDMDRSRSLYEQALAIRKQAYGIAHPATALSINGLAGTLQSLGDLSAARSLYEQALDINQRVLGAMHPATGVSLNNLAGLLTVMGDYEAALPLCEQSLSVAEDTLGPDHPSTATALYTMAYFFYCRGQYMGAKPLYERALTIMETAYGSAHTNIARALNNLALLYYAQGAYNDAHSLMERALIMMQQTLGPSHETTVKVLANLEALTALLSAADPDGPATEAG